MDAQPWQRRPPVGYWDLWPSGPVPDSEQEEKSTRASIQKTSVPCDWHFFGMSVFDNQTVLAGEGVEQTAFCKTLGWIFKLDAITVNANANLFLTVSDASSGRKMLENVCTHNISGGEPGKGFATFAYILGPRNPLEIKIVNRGTGTEQASLILLGRLYRGEL